MPLTGAKKGIIAVLVIIGIYTLIFHTPDPWGATSHESVGLGKEHLAHSVVGIILLVVAGLVWYKGRGMAAPAPAPKPA